MKDASLPRSDKRRGEGLKFTKLLNKAYFERGELITLTSEEAMKNMR